VEPAFGAPAESSSGRTATVQIGVIYVASPARSTRSLPAHSCRWAGALIRVMPVIRSTS